MKEITIKVTEANLVSIFGADAVLNLATHNKYKPEVRNPDYVPAVGNETMDDPDGKTEMLNMNEGMKGMEPEMYESPVQVPNPDYVAEVGEPRMANPVSAVEFLGEVMTKNAIEQTALAYKNKVVTDAISAAKTAARDGIEAGIAGIIAGAEVTIVE